MAKAKTKGPAQHSFSAETDKILQLMIHSLYANKEIYLRELISNASDACDKRRYAGLTDAKLHDTDQELAITITTSEKENSITITDTGIGMNEAELIENLGTIARSGTQRFLEAAKDNDKDAVELIGQFGVGFYASFMVADKVEVISRKAGEKQSYKWTSDGKSGYEIEKADNAPVGTKITLYLKEDEKGFLDQHRIRHIVQTYSNHITFPITLIEEEGKEERLNDASAIWAKAKKDITEEEYNAFYKQVAHAGDDPWLTLHNKVEGAVEYSNLLYVPTQKPFDLLHPERKTRVKLYVKRVFISEEIEIIPAYLRFVQGIVDSADLPLNISRETLQHNHVIAKIKNGLTKRILGELKKKAEKKPEEYNQFWGNFGAVLKEGLCEGVDVNRELLLETCRFKSLKSGDKLISLDDYIADMKDGQENIYYLIGDTAESLRNSPQLEGFISKGFDVILLADPVDDFWVNAVHEYKDKKLSSATRAGIELDEKEEKDEKKEDTAEKDQTPLIDFIKNTLGDIISDVVPSKKLTTSPVCLSVKEGAMDIRMERFMVNQQQLAGMSPKILEINTDHPLLAYIEKNSNDDNAKELVHYLYDQACILEGEPLNDPSAFAKRCNRLIELGIG